jgi:serine/threonine-protein kinase RsbW
MSGPDAELVVRLAGDLAEIARLPALVDDFAERSGLPAGLAATLNLVLEELVANIVMYGYDDDGAAPTERAIEIRLSRVSDVITLQVEDDAKPFDPLQRDPPDTDAALDDREPGGLGIHFVRTLMDTVEYHRAGGRNRMTMTKNIPPSERDA